MSDGPFSAVVADPTGEMCGLWHGGEACVLPATAVPAFLDDASRFGQPRWAMWSARADAAPAARLGYRFERVWDLMAVHRLRFGGDGGTPAQVWAGTHGLDPAAAHRVGEPDLLTFAEARSDDELVGDDGHLRPDVASWLRGDPGNLERWARACADAATLQAESRRLPTHASTDHSESAAAVLCVELERDGLPIDRAELERLIAASAGPRAPSIEAQAEIRAGRDAVVTRHLRTRVDLRNPLALREALAAVGVRVESTRKSELEAYRHVHPVVSALLEWRRAERIATTYGYAWMDAHVGADDRLRGRWSASDGAAGRMVADTGLHNLPTPLRSAVAAAPGRVLVRADLGQIEPRVLAVVSQDPALVAASGADDLYADIAARLNVDRPMAKIAVLSAMYGQRTGPAAGALRTWERAYPVAMHLLEAAHADGAAGRDVETIGGRRIRLTRGEGDGPAQDAARGRFARNAIIQGAAAELFKAWMATLRARLAHLDARIVLCLHDEVLVDADETQGGEVLSLIHSSLAEASGRWSRGVPVRFLADADVMQRWSQAKD